MQGLVDSFMDVPVSVAEYEYGEAEEADSEMESSGTAMMMSDDLNADTAAASVASSNAHR